MSTEEKKPSGYINVVADLTLLQRIVCCNHDITISPADTPRNHSKSAVDAPKDIRKEVEIAVDEIISP